MDTIAQRIKIALEHNNMKQADLVEKTGIGKSSISTYISGSYEPKQKNISKMAEALSVNEYWLMGYDVPMERNECFVFDKDSVIFDLTEENFRNNPEICQSIFNGVGELSFNMSSFLSEKDKPNYIKLSSIFNDIKIPLKNKIDLLRSLIRYVKYNKRKNQIEIFYNFSFDDNDVMTDYNKLNETGKAEARKRIHELTYLDEYRNK